MRFRFCTLMRSGLTSGNLSLKSYLVISKQQKIGRRRSVATVGGGQNKKTKKNQKENRSDAHTFENCTFVDPFSFSVCFYFRWFLVSLKCFADLM